MKFGDRIQEADWKKEKHVPVIECPDRVKLNETFEVKVSLGKEIAHPNTSEHHIRWISLYFHPQGAKFTYDVSHVDFNAHGESGAGPNQGPVYTYPAVTTSLKINKPGTLHALAYCNIHGLWEGSKQISVV
ncbi:MAG TPA: Neelaredoxin [Anaerolineae bacterium]|nr:Neelaredoxin [Anaerolineae bacterium]